MKLVAWFRDGSDAESQIKPVTDIVASIEYDDVDHHYGDVGDGGDNYHGDVGDDGDDGDDISTLGRCASVG